MGGSRERQPVCSSCPFPGSLAYQEALGPCSAGRCTGREAGGRGGVQPWLGSARWGWEDGENECQDHVCAGSRHMASPHTCSLASTTLSWVGGCGPQSLSHLTRALRQIQILFIPKPQALATVQRDPDSEVRLAQMISYKAAAALGSAPGWGCSQYSYLSPHIQSPPGAPCLSVYPNFASPSRATPAPSLPPPGSPRHILLCHPVPAPVMTTANVREHSRMCPTPLCTASNETGSITPPLLQMKKL